jgi:flagellar protein FliO/FliZ
MNMATSCVVAASLGVGILTWGPLARGETTPGATFESTANSASTSDGVLSAPEPPPSSTTTQLALRPDHPAAPLQLANDASGTTLGWKLLAVAIVVGGVVYALRRRSAAQPATADLVIVRRVSLGLRNELLVVNVDGQRLLLGVTPHSIHSLAVLDSPLEHLSTPAAEPSDGLTIGSTLGTMLDAIEDTREADRPAKRSSTAKDDQIPGQARGLASLRRRR